MLRTNPEGILKDFQYFGFLFEALCTRDIRVYGRAHRLPEGLNSGRGTRIGTRDTGHGTTIGTRDTGHGTTIGTRDTGRGTTIGTRDTGHGTTIGTRDTRRVTKESFKF